jgi:DNA-binding PadR family transcriptional regulator
MTVRESLLAILDHGPSYGYQLRIEFVRRTGGARPLNVGQVYTTLDRLERDGLVESSRVRGAGHVEYTITPKGRDEVRRWLKAPLLPSRDEFAMKLALALTLPGVDPRPLIAAQRSALRVSIDRPEPKSFSGRLIAKSEELRVEADLRWLEHCESMLDAAESFPPDPDTPKRGRPPAS